MRLCRAFSTKVFNRATKCAQRNASVRVENRQDYEYLHDEIADRLVDRLQDIQRDFPRALDLGCGTGHILKQLQRDIGLGGIEKLVQCDMSENMVASALKHVGPLAVDSIVVDEGGRLPFETASFDLVFSSMNLHWINDIPATLQEIRRCLRPDGVFLGAMLGGETLKELRSAFLLAEQERAGGVGPHISPLANIADIGRLLQGSGFALPTVDTDYIQVNYANAFELMEHLQMMAENNANVSHGGILTKDTFIAMAAAYQELYGNEDGTVPATFQILYMIGWSPDKSQPKPLSRGSAKHSMAELQRK